MAKSATSDWSAKKRHPLIDIPSIAIGSIIANGDDWTDMEDFGKAQLDWLRTRLELPNGIPSRDTFRRVLILLPPERLQACFVKRVHIAWLKSGVERREERY